MATKELNQETLKELLNYNPETGDFTWKVSRGNNKVKGSIAGSPHNGYIQIKIFGKHYKAHRLAFLFMEGFFPKNILIDHKDRVRHHNWWDNLRLASKQCNARNCKTPANNTSGIKGVSWHKPAQKWMASLRVNKKKKYLGLYENFDNAVCARLMGEQCLNWSGCDSSSSAYQYVQGMLNRIKR